MGVLIVFLLGMLGQLGFAMGLDESRQRLVELASSRADIGMEEFLLNSAKNYVVATSVLLRPQIEHSTLDCELEMLSSFEEKLNALIALAEGKEVGGGATLVRIVLEEGSHRQLRLSR